MTVKYLPKVDLFRVDLGDVVYVGDANTTLTVVAAFIAKKGK
jgi:hypothetical protein